MALISRRSIQHLVNESTAFMTDTQLRRLVGRLNLRAKGGDAFASEWELIVLSCLSKVVELEYEPIVAGRQWPDVVFTLSSGERIVIEISAVSDDDIKRKNPVESLFRVLGKWATVLRAKGVTGGFQTKIGTRIADDLRRGRRLLQPRLAIPQEQELNKYVFSRDFKKFIEEIIFSPTTHHKFQVKNDLANLSIDYDPMRHTSSASMIAFDVPVHPEFNPVYLALRKKARQLGGALGDSDTVVRGIVLCDGGCALFGHSGFSGTYSFGQVVEKFLTKNPRIQFVLGIDVQKPSIGDPSGGWTFRTRLFTRHYLDWTGELATIFDKGLSLMPRPKYNVPTALHRLADIREVRGSELARLRAYSWGYAMQEYSNSSDLSLEISATAVIDLITGRLDQEGFERIIGPEAIRYLRDSMNRGLFVSSIELRNNRDGDDDTLVIKFSGHDPARSEFRTPSLTPPD